MKMNERQRKEKIMYTRGALAASFGVTRGANLYKLGDPSRITTIRPSEKTVLIRSRLKKKIAKALQKRMRIALN